MLVAGLVYLGTLNNPFIYDDYRVIVENHSLQNLSQVRGILLQDASRPVVNLTYAIDQAVWGSSPFGFHLTNLLLHVLNVGLLFLVAWRLASDGFGVGEQQERRWLLVAFAASALFAVHPVMTAAVGYISGRTELLCATFFLLALLAARQWIVAGERLAWLAAAIGLWMLALGSKEIAAMFPFVLLWYERCFHAGDEPTRRRRLWRLHGPFLVIATVAVAARLAVFVLLEYGTSTQGIEWRFALVELDVVVRYLTLLILRHGQSIFHDVPLVPNVLAVRAIVAMTVVGSMVAIAWRWRTRRRLISLGLVWFLLLLVPSAVLVMLDRGEPMAEHRVYLASAGLFIGAGAFISRMANYVVRPVFKMAVRLAFFALLAVFAGQTLMRNAFWGDPVRVWAEAVGHAPNHWLPYLPLGEALHNAGRHEEAIDAFKQVTARRPEELGAYGRLGTCLTEVGQMAEAEAAFTELRRRAPQSAVASNGLGAVALVTGRAEEARRRYEETLEMDPANVQARRGLVVLAETVDANPAEALRLCQEIERLSPGEVSTTECIRRNRARLDGGG